MATQTCPNCQRTHDTAVYVTGQRLQCACGIRFEVKRTDVSMLGSRATTALKVQAPGDHAGSETVISKAARVEIPGYELHELLGRGGMGEVWKATQMSLGRTVAVKVLPARLAGDPEFVKRFDKEATALAALRHPNIIQIIDRGVVGENYYFVMEYVEGSSLREVMNAGKLSPDAALKIVAQICQAIDYAHEKQIIHRDLKPENILLDRRGHVTVADFGLAGIRGPEVVEEARLTAASVAMGTINYMAPEQRRDARNVDGRADLYSLGVILYELLVGELPVGRFRLPSERIPELDPRIDQIVASSLESDPAHRVGRASVIQAALESVVGPPASTVGVDLGPHGTLPAKVITRPDRPASGTPAPAPAPSETRSVVRAGWHAFRLGLAVFGAVSLAVVGFMIVARGTRTSGPDGEAGANHGKRHDHPGPGTFPPNTNGELRVAASTADREGGTVSFQTGFDPGREEVNAYAGTWTLEAGRLKATQAGNETGGMKLIPRAYFANRYFSTDDLDVETEVTLRELEDDFPIDEEAQRFAEVALRIKDLQISIFAIPGTGLRLMWRYVASDQAEVVGNSAQDLENMVEDEMPCPPMGQPIRLRMVLERGRGGTLVEAFANGQRFARKLLPGLSGQVGKVALGCRNLHCEFDSVRAIGRAQAKVAMQDE